MNSSGDRWTNIVLLFALGLGHFVRGIAPLLPPEEPPSTNSWLQLVSGTLMFALAGALWIRRGVRPLVLATVPAVLASTASVFLVSAAKHQVPLRIERWWIPIVVSTLWTLAVLAFARSLWRAAGPERPPRRLGL